MPSPFTLGLFAPLPLAMMIPFMATQSLAMGEAFGKSFQYGKRKISSMSNEEFNKLTMKGMMQEQTANIQSLIPDLHIQMEQSYKIQEDVFKEMVKLIPALINGVKAGLEEVIKDPLNDFYADSLRTSAESDQQQSQIVNVHLDGQSQTTTGDAGTGNTVDPQVQRVLNFRNKIANWDKEWTLAAIARPQNYQDWEMLELKAHLQKIITFEGKDDKVPEQTPLTTQEKAQKAYLTKTINLEKAILALHNRRGTVTFNIKNAGPISHLVASLKKVNKDLKVAEKALMNYITISKNNPLLKSVANRDWNDRIWLH